jgi:hypothetical protein
LNSSTTHSGRSSSGQSHSRVQALGGLDRPEDRAQHAHRGAVADDHQAALFLVGQALDGVQRAGHRLTLDRLAGEGVGPHRQAEAALVRRRDDMDRDVAGLGGALQHVQQRPAVHVRKAHVQHDRVGLSRRISGSTAEPSPVTTP